MRVVWVPLAVVLAVVPACGAGDGDPAGTTGGDGRPPPSGGRGPEGRSPVPLTTVAVSATGPTRPGRAVARSAPDWEAGWLAHDGSGPAPGPIDFGRRMVVAVFQGEKPSAGYSVRIEAAFSVAGGLEVRYVEVSPGPDCLTASVITSPFHAVSVDRVDGEVSFTGERRVEGCGS